MEEKGCLTHAIISATKRSRKGLFAENFQRSLRQSGSKSLYLNSQQVVSHLYPVITSFWVSWQFL